MKVRWKIFTVAVCILFIFILNAGAQESFDDSFAFDEGLDSEDSSGSGGLFGFLDGSALHLGGKASFYVMGILGGDSSSAFFDIDKVDDAVYISPELFLDVSYAGRSSEVMGTLKFDMQTIQEYPQDILNELTLRFYAGDFVIEGGKMKLVWGKGDNLHVIDNFNANDFTLFIIPEYIDRRLAEPMFHVAWNAPIGLRAEAVYAPIMTADRFARDGIWKPSRYAAITAIAQEILAVQGKAALTANDAASLMAIAEKEDTIIPSTSTFDYGQIGLRLTYTIGMVDIGASYYYGHYKQPSVDLSGYLYAMRMAESGDSSYLSKDAALPKVHYDRLQVFGLEAAAALGRFNLRGELAYYLTGDIDGDDPWTRNNSIDWVAGFDVDIPIHNLNLNVQNIGKYVLRNDRIGSGSYPAKYDVDYKANDQYVTDQISIVLKDTFLREKLALSCNVVVGIGVKDLLVKPVVSYNVFDDLILELSGMYITSGDNGDFHDYQDNSYIQIMMSYKF